MASLADLLVKDNAPGVYVIQNLVNGKVYVGSALNIRKRLRWHLADLRKGRHCNGRLQRAWVEFGASSFAMHPFVNTSPERVDRLRLEQLYIDLLGACDPAIGYNIAPKAGSNQGVKRGPLTDEQKEHLRRINTGKRHSDESKAKTSAALAGRCLRGRGFKHSEEHKDLLSETNRQTWKDPEIRARRLAAMSGRPCADSVREKIGDSNARKSYVVTFPDGHKQAVKNLSRFCREIGLGRGFHNVLNGTCKQYKGYHIERYEGVANG